MTILEYEGYIKSFAPSDWQIFTFKDLFEFNLGMGISRDQLGDDGCECLHYGDIHCSDKHSIDFEKEKIAMPKFIGRIKLNSLLKNGDLVLVDASEDLEGTCRSMLIKNVNNEKFISGLHTIVISSKGVKVCDSFKEYITSIDYIKKQIMKLSQGTKVYGINTNNLGKVKIALPTVDEQKKISKILFTWDEAIKLKENAIEMHKNNFETYLSNLMSESKNDKTFYLNQIATLVNGYAFLSESYNNSGKYKIVTIANVQKGEFVTGDMNLINTLPNNITNNQLLSKDDILISMTGNVGRVCKTPENGLLLNQRVGKLIPNEQTVLRDYLYYKLTSKRFLHKMIILGQGGAQPNLSSKDINKYQLNLPELENQVKIVKFLTSYDKQISLLKEELKQLKKLKKGLMQNLLTGLIRVNTNE